MNNLFDKEYFNRLVKRLDKKIDNEEYDECLDLIQEQLIETFIPNDYFNTLNEYKQKVLDLKKQKQSNLSNEHLSKEEYWNLIYNNNRFDMCTFEVFIEQYQNQIDENDLCQIQIILLDKKIKLDIKLFLFTLLKDLKIDYDFQYINKYDLDNKHETYKYVINPIKDYENLNQFNEYKKQLLDHYYKNPSMGEMAVQTLTTLSHGLFPNIIPIEYETVETITKLIEHFFYGSLELNDQQILTHPLVILFLKLMSEDYGKFKREELQG